MPKMTIQEARELGLLSPEELAALGHNPFTPRAGASWTPQLGIRPGLNSSSFFRYPGLYQRPGISSLRFGLGGLRGGLTLSPESPALGLAGIAAPVGRSAATRGPSYGVAGGVAGGIAGGVAGGRAAVGSEGSGNLPTMLLPDGRRLVRMPDGRVYILGGPQRMVSAEAPEGMAALQSMGLISQGVGAVKQLADLISKIPGGTPGGTPGGIPGGAPGGVAEEPAAGPGAGLVQPASLQQGPATPAAALLPPPESGAGAIPGLVASTPEEAAFLEANAALQGAAAPGGMPVPRTPEEAAFLEANLGGGAGSSPFGPGSAPQGPGPEFWRSLEAAPSVPSPGVIAPGEMMPGQGGGDLSLSPAFYATGGVGFDPTDPETRRLYELGLTPQQIMGMMPAPAVGPGQGRDLDPRGLGVGPAPSDIFAPEPAGPGVTTNATFGNILGLNQSLLGVGQGAIGAGITGDPSQLIGALIKSGMSVNQIAKIPGLNQAGISAGLGGALGVLNAVQAARSGNIQGVIGGGLGAVGSAANLVASSPALQGLTGIGGTAAGATGAIAGGAGGLLSLASGIQGLIKGGVPPLQSALQLTGGLTGTYGALASLSAAYPALFGTVLPSLSSLAGSGLTAVGLPGVASALGLGGGAAAGGVAALGGGSAIGATTGITGAALAAAEGGAVAGGSIGATGVAAAAPVLAQAAGPVALAAILYGILDSIDKAGWNAPKFGGKLAGQLGQQSTGLNALFNLVQNAKSKQDLANGVAGYIDYVKTGPEGYDKGGIGGFGEGLGPLEIGGLPGATGTAHEWGQTLDYDPYTNAMQAYINLRAATLPGPMPTGPQGDVKALFRVPAWSSDEILMSHLQDAAITQGLPMEQAVEYIAKKPEFFGKNPAWIRGMADLLYNGVATPGTAQPQSLDQLESLTGKFKTLYADQAYQQQKIMSQAAAAPAAPPVASPFDPLAFLSHLQAGERAQIQSGQDTLTFVPYKPDQSQMFAAPDAGYEQIGEGFYAKASGQGAGAEIYLPQDKASELGKALAGYQGSPVAGQVGSLLAPPVPVPVQVPSGQEVGATPGAGPAGDIAPVAPAQGQAAPAGTRWAVPGENPYVPGAGNSVVNSPPPDASQPVPGSGFKKGGVVPKTGKYLVHEGEVVIPADKADTEAESEEFLEDMRLAHHEESETVQDEQTGKWVNVYGRNIKGKAGQRLPNSGEYDTVEEAEAAAGARSEAEGQKGSAKPPKVKGWYVHIKEGVPSQDLDGNDPMVRRLAFTPDEVEQALEAGEAPIMVGKGVLTLPPSAIRGFLQNAQNMQNKDPMKHPAMVAMGNRIRQTQAMEPEGNAPTLPYPGLGGKILRGNQPRFKGDRGRGADKPLDSVGRESEIGGGLTGPDDTFRNMDVLPKAEPSMPSIPDAPENTGPLQVRGLGGPGIGRAMRLAQGPVPAEDFARQDRMLEGIDRGTIAPSTLGGASREQRRNLTPQDIMRRPSKPGAPQPQPGLLEQFRRRVTG
jgi:hypothetical protein